MNKLCILVCMTILGAIGWWAGSLIGVMTGYVLSSIGTLAGVYAGWRINRDYFS